MKRFMVLNATDGIYAHPKAVSRAEGERLIANIRARFQRQGYYASVEGHIPVAELKLELEPVEEEDGV